MIPSITLDNMVRKLKNQDNIETSYDDLFICEEKLQKELALHQPESKVCRTMSQRSKRRLFFSIAGPQICSSPITPHRRRPLSPSARPMKSSLKIPPESLKFASPTSHQYSPSDYKNLSQQQQQNEDSIVAGPLFRRNGYGRRSERFTSATMAKTADLPECFDESSAHESTILGVVNTTENNESDGGKLKRNSFLRRSLNAIRSKTGRSSMRKSMNFRVIELPDVVPEDSEVLISPEKEEEVNEEEHKKEGKSSIKNLWKRLFLSKKGSKIGDNGAKVELLRHDKKDEYGGSSSHISTTTISFVRLENQHDDPTEPHHHLLNSHFALGYYTGIGRKFERIASGSEITLVVFGHTMAGKTTFVRSLRQLFLEGTDRIRVVPIAERYRLAGIGMMPFPEGDNRLPHIVSLVINNDADDVEYVLDVIDPEYDNSNLPQAYMDACDAAILLIDGRNCASLLSAHQIQRNMKGAHANVQIEILLNMPFESSCQALPSEHLETTMGRKAIEMCCKKLNRQAVEEMLLALCERVSAARRPASIISKSDYSSPTTSSSSSRPPPRSFSSV